MKKILPIREGDLVVLRKPHACGANLWKVTQLGADVRLTCQRCSRRVLIPRDAFDRKVVQHLFGEELHESDSG